MPPRLITQPALPLEDTTDDNSLNDRPCKDCGENLNACQPNPDCTWDKLCWRIMPGANNDLEIEKEIPHWEQVGCTVCGAVIGEPCKYTSTPGAYHGSRGIAVMLLPKAKTALGSERWSQDFE